MIRKLAKLFSYLFHPLLMPVLGVFLIFISGSYLSLMPAEGKRYILLITALSTMLLPISILPFLYYQKVLSKVTIPERHERIVPLFTTVIFYFFGYYVMRRLSAPDFIQYFLLSSFICVLLAAIIHLKYKISLHMIGFGGMIGLIAMMGHSLNVNISIILMLFIALSGIIGSSRLYLKAHSVTEVYSGFSLGFIGTFSVMFLLY